MNLNAILNDPPKRAQRSVELNDEGPPHDHRIADPQIQALTQNV